QVASIARPRRVVRPTHLVPPRKREIKRGRARYKNGPALNQLPGSLARADSSNRLLCREQREGVGTTRRREDCDTTARIHRVAVENRGRSREVTCRVRNRTASTFVRVRGTHRTPTPCSVSTNRKRIFGRRNVRTGQTIVQNGVRLRHARVVLQRDER